MKSEQPSWGKWHWPPPGEASHTHSRQHVPCTDALLVAQVTLRVMSCSNNVDVYWEVMGGAVGGRSTGGDHRVNTTHEGYFSWERGKKHCSNISQLQHNGATQVKALAGTSNHPFPTLWPAFKQDYNPATQPNTP